MNDHNENPFTNNPNIKKEPDYNAFLNSSRINFNDVIPVPPICIEVIINGTAHTFGTLGNCSMLIGKAKAGKTFALSLILAAALVSGEPFQKVLRATFSDDKKTILYFDTEQSRYHVHKVLKRICAISGVPVPDNLIVYSLRKYSALERLEMIEYALYNTPNIGMVVIDGIRDLITSINDEEQASMITSKLLKWSEELNIHIITVLHQNKGDINARGHLGTELTNKSETVTAVSKGEDKNISIISAEYCRDKNFEPIAFIIDLDGLPNIIDGFAVTSKTEQRKKIAPYDIPPETHKIIINDVFSVQSEMIRSELKTAASANISRHLGYDLGQNKIAEWINHWLQFKHIGAMGTPGTKACKYSINNNEPTKPLTELN
jgi:AAA domain-containing protein